MTADTATQAASGQGPLIGAAGGLLLGVVGYLLFSWGMASGLIPVPSAAARRRVALVLLVVTAGLLALQVAMVVWAQLER